VAEGCAPSTGHASQSLALSPAAVDLITQIQQAPYLVAHGGVRRVESHYDLDGFNDHLVYREQVVTDGQGSFTIDPLGAVQGATLPAGDFQLLQKAREGFHFRYRDFLVRDLAAFIKNYQLTSLGSVVQVAGRDCLEVQIARMDGTLSFELAMDVETGLVLRYLELDAAGKLFSKMEYESYDPAPQLAGVTFHQPGNQEQALDLSLPVVQQVGFQPFVPRLLPSAGFFFVEATQVTDATGTTWVKQTYTDGVETAFFLDAGPSYSAGIPVGVKSAGTQGLAGLSQVATPAVPDQVSVFHDGPLTVLWGEVLEHQVIVLGKADRSELLGMLESALPAPAAGL
jgi:hypothetical protein